MSHASIVLWSKPKARSVNYLEKKNHFLLQIREYEKLQFQEDRLKMAREIFDKYIMIELLACSHVSV